MTDDLFTALIRHTKAEKGRTARGITWYNIQCPACSTESKRNDPHCSFNATFWHCLICGSGGSLTDLARRVDLDAGDYRPPAPARKEPPARLPSWIAQGPALVDRYHHAPGAYEAWQSYKPIWRQTFDRAHLGVGVLPSSKCPHQRLIVPVLDGTMVVGLRGRSLGCDCGKWLVAGGTTLEMLPLYNADQVGAGDVVMIVENPVDALMVAERTPYTGVATYSVSYWRDEWTAALQAARPELIVVAYDNDLPGQGGGVQRAEFLRQWFSDPKHKLAPKPNGVRLANDLIRAGLPARLFDWGRQPNKADIGSLLMSVGGAA